MKHLLDDVWDFHQAGGIPAFSTPMFPDDDRITLRRRLIREEYYELMLAISERDLVETADAMADLIYVVVGAALEFGIPLDRVWNEVQRSNMAKVDPATGAIKRRFDGKIEKPDGWSPPDIRKVLESAS